jgi:hypothetical protein
MAETISYCYRIAWSIINKHYYGVRYSKNCNPSDFWKTYFTSSKTVDEYRKIYGEPDIIEIRKTFFDREKAIDWEFKVLKKLNVKNNDNWLNIAIGKPTFLGKKHSNETLLKMRKPKPEGFAAKISKFNKGKSKSEEHKLAISNSKKGKVTHCKKWNFSLNEQLIEINNLGKYCKENNLNVSCMKDVYYGRQNQHKNYRKVANG